MVNVVDKLGSADAVLTAGKSLAAAGLLVAFLVLTLTGCTERTSGLTPHQSRDRMVKVVDETVAALGASGDWKPEHEPYPEACQGDGVPEGVWYTYGGMIPAGKDIDTDVATVKALWQKLGVTVTVTTEGTTTIWGKGGPIGRLELDVDPRSHGLSAVSTCVSGDVSQIVDHDLRK